jgi:nitrite reductase/ring-hydroxylating ferredoxin subunit
VTITIKASDIPVNGVVPLTEDVCVVRTADGVYALDRVCPHAGADLATGYVLAGQLRCTWHNLPYDPRTGRQPCASLPHLRTYPVREVDPGIYQVELDS